LGQNITPYAEVSTVHIFLYSQLWLERPPRSSKPGFESVWWTV